MSKVIQFCTLFDSNYLTRGLALYRSLEDYCAEFHLYVLAFDQSCEQILGQLSCKHLTVVGLADFEDERMQRIKQDRTNTEYCWTCASHFTRYCLIQYQLDQCTYIDADMKFYSDPSIIFEENTTASVFITPHRYTKKYDISALSGIYCVQFVSFKNTVSGMSALNWWCDACEEWCYNRHEDGKFGDQKYLDDWPTRFRDVHVVQSRGAGLAVWNIQQYTSEKFDTSIRCKEVSTNKYFVPIFFHFHYLKFFSDSTVELGRKKIGRDMLELFYFPYINELLELNRELANYSKGLDLNGTRTLPKGIKQVLITMWRKFKGVYHIYSLNNLN